MATETIGTLDYNEIVFPKLGIDLHVNSTAFSIGGLDIQWYGILITLGLVLAMIYAFTQVKKYGLNPDRVLDCIIGGIIGGVVGARAYYVLLNWSDYAGNWKSIFNIRGGGLAIYGGIIAGVITGALICRHKKIPVMALGDLAAFGLLIGQAIGRWGNFINREAFGGVTDVFCRMGLTVPGSETIYVHPTFLYESLWNFAGLIALYILLRRDKRQYDGQFFCLYIFWYGLGRSWVEGLRTDSLYIGSTDIRVSQLLAIVSAVTAAVILIINARKKHSPEELFVNRSTRIKKPEGQEGDIENG